MRTTLFSCKSEINCRGKVEIAPLEFGNICINIILLSKMDLQLSPLPQNGSGLQMSPRKIREAKYEVLLFFVELLMEHKSRKLHDLSCLFGSPNFSLEMKQVVGGSQMGLKRFLLKYPSLFTIKGDTVTMTCYDFEELFRNGHEINNGGSKENMRTPTLEEEAVEFFRSKLLAAPIKDECRLPLRSLIGHRSQAPEKIRAAMGRTLPDFIRFIRAHGETFMYDSRNETVQLTQSAQKNSCDCASPNSSSSSQSASLASGEFDVNECLEFLASVLQQKGPLFLDELYGHLNKKYKPDVRQHFAKNPRELGEMIQQKSNNRFRVEGNLVSYHQLQLSPQEQPGSVRSPPGSAREGMKLKLAQTLSKVMTENKARGVLPEPESDKSWVIPWNEITKPKQLKSLVSEILDSSAGTEAVGLEFVYEYLEPSIEPTPETTELPFKISKIFICTFDGKVHLISILDHPELIRLGGLRELLISDKIRKVFHDGSKGLAAFISHYGLRVVNPFDTQVGFSILEYQNTENDPDVFLATDRSLSIIDVASGCAPATVRALSVPSKLDANETRLYEAYRNVRLVFPHIYEALKSRISVKFTPLMRTLLEEEYECYLNPERSKLLRKNRLTLHRHEVDAQQNQNMSNDVQFSSTPDESHLHEHVNTINIHDNICTKKVETAEASCQTIISGEIKSSEGKIYDDILQLIRQDVLSNGFSAIQKTGDNICDI